MLNSRVLPAKIFIGLLAFTLMTTKPAIVAADTVYAVKIAGPMPEKKAEKILGQMPSYSDVALVHTARGFQVVLGCFWHRQEAELLLKGLGSRFHSSEIIAVADNALQQKRAALFNISLKDLGYEQGLLVRGVNSYAALSYPWYPGALFAGSSLVLHLRLSPLLAPRSTIEITVNSVPLFASFVEKLGSEASIEIPLDSLSASNPPSDTLNIEIRGYLWITGNRCVDEASGNSWLLVENSSFLKVHSQGPVLAVNEFFHDYRRVFHLILEKETRANVETALQVSSLIGMAGSSLKTTVVFGLPTWKGKNVFIGEFPQDLKVVGSSLYLTPRGARVLAGRFAAVLAAAAVDVHAVEEASSSAAAPSAEVSFAELGLADQQMRGTGDLTATIPFNLSQLGGAPGRLSCLLVYAHTPIFAEDRGYLKVRLNGILLESVMLEGQGGIRNHSVELPVRYLHTSNTLEIVFSSQPEQGDCTGFMPQKEASVLADSAFYVDSLAGDVLGAVGDYAGRFVGQGVVVLSQLTPDYYGPAAAIVKLMGQIQKQPVHISLHLAGDPLSAEYRYAILCLQPEDLLRFHPIVDASKSFQVTNPMTGKVLVSVALSDTVHLLQAFETDSKIPVLAHCRVGSRARQALVLTAADLKKLSSGNVAIEKQGTWYTAQVGRKLRIVYPHRKGWEYYWVRYKLAVSIFLGTLGLLLLIYLQRTMTGRKKVD
ncbi:MAG: cellulose biosynthesis cyclic di-GMP-binding regulatory protein BcsB [Deltaproteobacteria bacterium]|nr:cellulose biosynthesis cyclic di-GMP-binding regulatory protein BcsB [Deltaproteobacteria bacterium]MBW2072684.1 cellulose biosynthesis cyclic di-GMP-binding regulatory protein BcsB [Deltaproteobacteria bacterium]